MKKMIAPVIIFILFLAYFLLIFVPIMKEPGSIGLKLIIGTPAIIFLGAFVKVFIERINEIRSGEEDDFSKY